MTRRVLAELDAGGDVRGYVCDGGGPVTVTHEDGTVRGYGPGLTLTGLPQRIASFDGAGTGEGGAPSCVLQLAALDLWGLRDRVPAQSVRGRVYWWPEGEAISESHEIYRGVVRDPEFTLGQDAAGAQAGAVSFTLAADTQTPDVPFPPATIGDEGRFPTAPEASLAQAVPVIYGRVRNVPLYAVTPTTSDPVRLLVAGHKIASATLRIMREGSQVHAGKTVLYDEDGRGALYAYIETTAAALAAGLEVYAQGVFATTEQPVIGWAGPDGLPIERLGDVLIHLWTTYAGEAFYDLDRRRAWGARPRLNRYRVGLLVNERQADGSLLRLLSGRFGGQFPVTFSFAGGRYGWDLTAPTPPDGGEPVAHLVYGANAQDRVGPRQTSVEDIITEFEIAYATDYYAGGPVASLRADRDNSGECRGAESRWGARPVRRIDAGDVPDADTAWTLLGDAVWWQTRPHWRVEYTCHDAGLFDAPLGAEVAVTDAECGWDAEVFFVEAVAPVEADLARDGTAWQGMVRVVLVSGKGL